MPSSSSPHPQTEHRDIGLGVTFFQHPHRSSSDNRLYHYTTHLPTLGYCPGCSSKANMNLKSPTSSTPTTPALSTSTAPTSSALQFSEDDLIDHPEPDDGVLVTAETHHSGPSYTTDTSPIDVSEDTRYRMVKVVLDRWAEADDAKNKQLEKRISQYEKKKLKRRMELEREMNEARTRRKMMQKILEEVYDQGMVKRADVPVVERGDDGDEELIIAREHKFAGEDAGMIPNPSQSQNTNKATSVRNRKKLPVYNDQGVEFIGQRKLTGVRKRKFTGEPGVAVRKINQHKTTRQPVGKENKKKRGLGLGLVPYEEEPEAEPESGYGVDEPIIILN